MKYKYLTKKQLNFFNEAKAELEQMQKKGFKFPSGFRCALNDNEIKELQILAWLRHISGRIPSKYITYINGERTIKNEYMTTIDDKKVIKPEIFEQIEEYLEERRIIVFLNQNEHKYFESCLYEFRIFIGTQAYETEKAEREEVEKKIKELKPLAAIGEKFTHKPDELRAKAKAKALERKKELMTQKKLSPREANTIVKNEFDPDIDNQFTPYWSVVENFTPEAWKKFLQPTGNVDNSRQRECSIIPIKHLK